MIGLSSSPVVGAALPAPVTGIAGAVAIFFRNSLDAQIGEMLKSWTDKEQGTEPKAEVLACHKARWSPC